MDYIESDYEYIKKALNYVYNSVIYMLFLVVLIVMHLMVTYMGVKNLMNCPKQPKIPIYLFVGGALGLVKLLQTLYDQWRRRRKEKFDSEIDNTGFESGGENGVERESGFGNSSKYIDILISLFLFIWFCIGNYWVFTIYEPNYQQPRENDSQNWCSKNVYMSAVYYIIMVYVLAVMFLLIGCLLFIVAKTRRQLEENEPEEPEPPKV